MRRIIHTIHTKKMCRNCINETLDLDLHREQCQYWQYPGKCSVCGQVRNIVVDVTFAEKLRIWFRKKIITSR